MFTNRAIIFVFFLLLNLYSPAYTFVHTFKPIYVWLNTHFNSIHILRSQNIFFLTNLLTIFVKIRKKINTAHLKETIKKNK